VARIYSSMISVNVYRLVINEAQLVLLLCNKCSFTRRQQVSVQHAVIVGKSHGSGLFIILPQILF
jgi:hypothetical protein